MAITITPGTTRTDLNGTTAVTIVAAPAANTQRVVLAIRVFNVDTAAVTVTLRKAISGTLKTLGKVTSLGVDELWTPVTRELIVVLGATTESLELVMSAAAATSNPQAEAEWIDRLSS